MYKLNGRAKINGKNMQEVELTPIDKTKAFHKVLLFVDKSTILTTRIFEKAGNRYTYSISNMKTNGNIANDVFLLMPKISGN